MQDILVGIWFVGFVLVLGKLWLIPFLQTPTAFGFVSGLWFIIPAAAWPVLLIVRMMEHTGDEKHKRSAD